MIDALLFSTAYLWVGVAFAFLVIWSSVSDGDEALRDPGFFARVVFFSILGWLPIVLSAVLPEDEE